MRRRLLIIFVGAGVCSPVLPSSAKTKKQNQYDEKRLLEQNKRIQRENNAPDEFPNFIREGFEVKVVTSDNYVKRDSGLVLWDIAVGQGDRPKDGQQVVFHYIGYNESDRVLTLHIYKDLLQKFDWVLMHRFQDLRKESRYEAWGEKEDFYPSELGPPMFLLLEKPRFFWCRRNVHKS